MDEDRVPIPGSPRADLLRPGLWLEQLHHVAGRIFHQDLRAASLLSGGARAAFTMEGDPQTRTTGALVSVRTTVDPQTRTVAAVFAVPNADRTLRVGQFARVSVPVGGTVRGVAIPTFAIIDDGGTPVAYVQAAPARPSNAARCGWARVTA